MNEIPLIKGKAPHPHFYLQTLGTQKFLNGFVSQHFDIAYTQQILAEQKLYMSETNKVSWKKDFASFKIIIN